MLSLLQKFVRDYPAGVRTSLGKKIVLAIIGISTFIAFFATVGQAVWEFRVAKDAASDRLHQIEIQHAPILEETLWILDEQLVKVHLSSVFLVPGVVAIKLDRPNEASVTLGAIPDALPFRILEKKIELQHIQDGRSLTLGTLKILISLDEEIALIESRILIILTANFLKTLIVGFFLLIFIHHLLGRHLIAMTLAINHHKQSRVLPAIVLDRAASIKKDELDILVDAYNAANTSLQNAMDRLERSHDGILDAKLEAEEMNRAKTLFLGNISHELRTPLSAIHGFIDILIDTPDMPEDQRQNVYARLNRNSSTLLKLVEELLDLTKSESGKLAPVLSVFELRPILEGTIHEFDLQIAKKNVSLTLKFAANLPDKMQSDPVLLTKIVRNLVGNAIKFTAKGCVTVDVRCENGHLLFIDVTDTGQGVESKSQEKIFLAFVQQDEAIAREFGGTGLGLAIARRAARTLGGDVTLVSSVVGQGSIFRAEIPI